MTSLYPPPPPPAAKYHTMKWYCPKYIVLQNAEHFPFGLERTYEYNKINMSNSMKLVVMIPEFEIISQIVRVDDLRSKDINENLVNNINCYYFS